MAKQFEEIENIEEIRNKISKGIDFIAQEKSLITVMRNNPRESIVITLIIGILAAVVSRKVIKLALILVSSALKTATVLFFIKKSLHYILKLKNFRR